MPLFDVYAGITYQHTVIADSPEDALASGEEAKEALLRYFSPSSFDPDDLVVWDDVLDLDRDAPDGDGRLFVLTACLSYDFQVEAEDRDAAEAAAGELVRREAESRNGIRGLGHSDISVWGIESQ